MCDRLKLLELVIIHHVQRQRARWLRNQVLAQPGAQNGGGGAGGGPSSSIVP